MTLEELNAALSVGPMHSCCIDVRHVPEAPGYVRTTALHEGHRVSIEFDVWGMDEGGLYFRAQFRTLAEMVQCMEEYLGRSLAEWRCLGPRDDLARPAEAGTRESHEQFRALLTSGQPIVPHGRDFTAQPGHWTQFMGSAAGDTGSKEPGSHSA
jgi:hypothetical protein